MGEHRFRRNDTDSENSLVPTLRICIAEIHRDRVRLIPTCLLGVFRIDAERQFWLKRIAWKLSIPISPSPSQV